MEKGVWKIPHARSSLRRQHNSLRLCLCQRSGWFTGVRGMKDERASKH
jgi:hypothetical protein